MSALDDLFPSGLRPAILNGLPGKPVEERPRENLFFEFKEKWNPRHIAKSVSAFANANGGYLIIGATQLPDGPLAALPGVDEGPDWAKQVSDNIVGHVSPLPAWQVTPFPAAKTRKVIVVVKVRESWGTPHIVTDTGNIYLRSPGGTSDPVTDRATLDRIVQRGRRGEKAIARRVRDVQARVEPVTPWRLLVTSVPLPFGSAHQPELFTRTEHTNARFAFHPADTLLRNPQVDGIEEDAIRINFAQNALGWVCEDGIVQIVYGWDTTTVNVGILGDVVVRAPAAQLRLIPPAHAARVFVRFEAVAPVQLSEGWRIEGNHGPAPGAWEWTDDVAAVSPDGLNRLKARFMARLWRALGKPVFAE